MPKFPGSFLFLFLALVFPCQSVYAQAPTLRGGAMLDCSGLPCVDLTLATGKRLRLLIDTGNVNSVLDSSTAKELGLPVAPVSGRDGKPLSGYGRTILTGINLGDASLPEVKFLVMDIAGYVKQDRMPAADGTLAYTAFKDRVLELDYRQRTVRFSDPLTAPFPCPGYCGTLTTPTFGKQGPPIVVSTGFSVDHKPVTAQIDTLFSGTMLVYPTSVDKLGLADQAKTTTKQFFKYTDGGVEMIEAHSKAEAFGQRVLAADAPVYFVTPTVHLPDGLFDATVGHALLQRSILSLDFHDMQMWLAE